MEFSSISLAHAVAGVCAIAAGFLAFLSKKGSDFHRIAGRIFVVSMLVSAALGIVLGFLASVMLSVIGGLQVMYLVTTSWRTINQPGGNYGVFEFISFVLALLIAGIGLFFGIEATQSDDGLYDGFPAILYFLYGSGISFVCAIGDLTVIRRGGVAGSYRLGRHLWRMGFALYVASASFFLGQPQVFPEAVRGTFVLASPVLLVVLLTLFWAVWVHVSPPKKFPVSSP